MSNTDFDRQLAGLVKEAFPEPDETQSLLPAVQHRIRRKRRRTVASLGTVAVVALAAAGTVIGMQSRESHTSTKEPVPTDRCHAVPKTDPKLQGKVELHIAVQGPMGKNNVPIEVGWSAPDKAINIDTGSPFEQAFLIDQSNHIVAQMDPRVAFAGVDLEYDVAARKTVHAKEPTFVGPLVTCAGKPVSSLPAGKYFLVVVGQAHLFGPGEDTKPHGFETLVSAPAPINLR